VIGVNGVLPDKTPKTTEILAGFSYITSAKFFRVRANHQYPKTKLTSAKAAK